MNKRKNSVTVVILILACLIGFVTTDFIQDRQVFESEKTGRKNELSIMSMIKNYDNFDADVKEQSYMNSFSMTLPVLSTFSQSDKFIYITDTENYQKVLSENSIDAGDKIKVKKDYTASIPLDNPAFLGNSINTENEPPVMVIITEEDRVKSYFYLDSRIIKIDESMKGRRYQNWVGLRVTKKQDEFLLMPQEENPL